MRAAPPVDYPLSRHGLWDVAASALAGAASAVPLAWGAWQLEAARMIGTSGVLAMRSGALLLAVLATAWVWRRSALAEPRRLRWDGQGWDEVDAAGHAEELAMPSFCIDLRSAVLLRSRRHGDGCVRWFPLERGSAPARWHALRVVLRRPGAAASGSPPVVAADGVPP